MDRMVRPSAANRTSSTAPVIAVSRSLPAGPAAASPGAWRCRALRHRALLRRSPRRRAHRAAVRPWRGTAGRLSASARVGQARHRAPGVRPELRRRDRLGRGSGSPTRRARSARAAARRRSRGPVQAIGSSAGRVCHLPPSIAPSGRGIGSTALRLAAPRRLLAGTAGAPRAPGRRPRTPPAPRRPAGPRRPDGGRRRGR